MPIELVSHDADAAQLVADGLLHRPELAESRHLVAEAAGRLDRERYAPLLPNLLLDVSQSGFGGGPGSTVADFRGRFDFDATAYWQLRNFGLGEVAAREGARSRLEQARLVQVRLMDQVSREIIEAHAQSASLRSQIAVAESGIRTAAESYRRNLRESAAVKACRWRCSSRSKPWTRAAGNTSGPSAITTSGNSASTAPWAARFPKK